jgi:hypothetical protein
MNPTLWREDATGSFPNAEQHHYSKGGGGKGDAAMMMMMMQQQQQADARAALEKEMQRQRDEQAKQVQLAKEEEEKKQTKIKAQSNLQKTLGSARNYGNMQNAQYGGDDRYGLLGLYGSLLDNAEKAIPEDDPNPSSFINANDLWSQAANTQRGVYRNKYRKQERDLYDSGFETRAIADEMDDTVLQSILGDQQGEARASLDRSRARGQLNDEAYGYAQSALGQQSASANNTLQGLGMTVLQKYRDSLTNRSRNLDTRVQDWDFGDDIDFDNERSQYERDLGRFKTNLEGDVRSAVGDRELYNMDLLLGKARSKAGTSNTPVTAPLTNAFASTPTTALNTRTDDPTKKNVGVF